MINVDLEHHILAHCGFEPTQGQREAVAVIARFLTRGAGDSVGLLCGYAGTGKTSLLAALVRTLMAFGQKVVLMAPTGRAAKVLSLYTGQPAYTIHKRIYRQKTFTGDMDNFLQNVNLATHTLFIVDEASMISGSVLAGSAFGTGCLLDDLVQFVYSGQGCRLLLVGDPAQLPPVGEELSPALMPQALQAYGLEVYRHELTEVVRQRLESGVLYNAIHLRQVMASPGPWGLPVIRLKGFADVRVVPGDELIECLEESFSHCGTDQTIVVTRSNKRANIYNNGIRGRILGREEELSAGDRLLIAKNNYHWPAAAGIKDFDFLANGDMAVVRRVRRVRDMHGFRFADVWLSFPDYDGVELQATVLLDVLQSEAPALSRQDAQRLFASVEADYADITSRRERLKRVKADPYFNALQVKFAYAVTCHKAQGGQWQRVFLDQGYVTDEMMDADYFRWLYTAFTRATEQLYLVNWPRAQTDMPRT